MTLMSTARKYTGISKPQNSSSKPETAPAKVHIILLFISLRQFYCPGNMQCVMLFKQE